MRIGFLFDHRSDQVWHAAPIAFELSQRYDDVEVVCLTANTSLTRMVDELARLYPGHNCRVEQAHVPAIRRCAETLIGPWRSPEKEGVLRGNNRFYRSLDALVAPDVTSRKIRGYHRLPSLSLILTRHGAGDRAGSFHQGVVDFDLVLAPGAKTQRDLEVHGLLRDTACRRVGYPKFSAVDRLPPPPRLFANDRPVILYNPHFDPALSSWPVWGEAVLDRLAQRRHDYNVIFAPHIKLFGRRARYRAKLPERHRRLPNIHVDLASRSLVDMTYTRLADIYLGDVSSQVYEFIRWPRPCVFLNPHGVAWQDNTYFRHWHLGDVVSSLDALGSALDRAVRSPARYRDRQRAARDDTFSPGADSSDRGAATQDPRSHSRDTHERAFWPSGRLPDRQDTPLIAGVGHEPDEAEPTPRPDGSAARAADAIYDWMTTKRARRARE